MITINMQYFGKRGGSSGKSGGAGKATKSPYGNFDTLSGKDKVAMLKQHSGSLTADDRDDNIGDEALWEHAKSEGTLLVEGKDYSVSDRKTVTLKSTRERFSYSKQRAGQNDSVSIVSGRSAIYQTKSGTYYMETIKLETSPRNGYEYFVKEVRKLNWK